MGQLLVVRHGQASLMRTNYDDLSARGREQSTMLGQCFAEHGWVFDSVYTGPAMRHRDTMRRVGKAMEAAQRPWPDAVELAGLAENDDLSLVRASVGALRDDPEVVTLRQQMLDVRDKDERSRRFQLLYEAVMLRWIHGDFEPQGVETWPQFRARVLSCVETMTSLCEPTAKIVAFTSVGPVAVLLQRALGVDDDTTFRLAWRLRNTALTDFSFDGRGRLSLESFNVMPHLRDPSSWTLR